MRDEPADASHAGATKDDAAQAGRGGLAVAGAKIWFVLVGFAQQTILPHLLGAAGYGALSSVQALVNIPNNVIVNCSIQGVSIAVAGAPEHARAATYRTLLRVHALLAPAVALALFVAAPLAADLMHAPHLVAPMRALTGTVLVYGLYAPMIGGLNGRRRLGTQAALDVTAATLRTAGVLAGAWLGARLGGPVLGAALGITGAALVLFPAATRIAGTGAEGATALPVRTHLLRLLPLALAQLFLNVLMQADISILRPLAHEAGAAAGFAGDDLLHRTDALVGVYRGAQLFAFLPYQLLLSITFVLFPMLARAHADGDRDATARVTANGTRLALLLAGLFVAVLVGESRFMLRFAAFPAEIAERGGTALRALALGQGCFTLFGVCMAALSSVGRERWSAVATGLAAALVAALCVVSLHGAPFGDELLARTALATATALGCASLGGAVLVRHATGGFAPLLSVARVALALGLAASVGARLPWLGRVAFLAECAAVAAVYVAALAVTRELGADDLGFVKRVLNRRR